MWPVVPNLPARAIIVTPVLVFALTACSTLGSGRGIEPRVAVGGTATCAVSPDGSARCWGLLNQSDMSPRLVHSTDPVRNLEPGVFQACGLSPDAVPMCTLGRSGASSDRPCATLYCLQRHSNPVGASYTMVTGGYYHACALDRLGRAFCWGANGMGQLGLGWRSADSTGSGGERVMDPSPVHGDLRFTTISAGEMHTCALTSRGEAYCWGYGQSGELGRDTVMTYCSGKLPQANAPCSVDRPVRVVTTTRFRAISAGMRLTCAISQGDEAYCWGSNYRCALGRCDGNDSPVPTRIAVPGKVIAIDAGYWHACAINAEHRAWCWGNNVSGQLGSLATADSGVCFLGGRCTPVPTEVAGGMQWRMISAGESHTCGLTMIADVYCWGARLEGRLPGYTGGEICENRSTTWKDEPCASAPVPIRGAIVRGSRTRQSGGAR